MHGGIGFHVGIILLTILAGFYPQGGPTAR